jgi:flagellar biosynthesis protein FlhG
MRSIAVVSGKGGVGKTNLSVNLALALGELGVRTAILDADLGLANVDILFGVAPRYNLGHVLRGERELEEILLPISEHVLVVPGGSGVQELADLDEQSQSAFIERLSSLEKRSDILLVDTGAGIGRNVLSFALASDQTILLTTAEPTAIRDSYGVLKSLVATSGGLDVSLVVNMAANDEDAFAVADRVQMAADQFLNVSVPYLGYVLWDRSVAAAVRLRRPFLLTEPDGAASRCVRIIARRLAGIGPTQELPPPPGRGFKAFLFRLARRLGRRGAP